MKLGIHVGKIPPPVFLEKLINGLSFDVEKIFVYGKVLDSRYRFKNNNVKIRKLPVSRFGIVSTSFYYTIKLLLKAPSKYLFLIKKLDYSFRKMSKILPILSDDLNLLHLQWPKALEYYSEVLEGYNFRIILSLRGTQINVSPIADPELAAKYRKYFKKIDGFHAVSSAIAKKAIKYNAPAEKIEVIRPAIDYFVLSKFCKKNINNKIFKIISIGRMHWVKGYTFVLDAIYLFKQKNIDFHYTIIASGNDREYLNYQIHDLGLINHVTIINGLQYNKTMEILSQSDLFILSSLDEGISNSVLESMTLGVPVLSTNCGGMEEVIEDNINGFLFPYREPEVCVKKIIKFIEMNKNEKQQIINNAKKTIKEKFSLDDQIAKMLSFYNKYL